MSFNTIFQQTLERTKTRIDEIASAVPSSTRIEHYPVAALTGRMREWVKDRVVQDLAAFEASVRNLTFEHTIGVPREDIEDDVTGAYALAIQQQAALGVLEPWLQVQDELGVGAFTTSVGFDGVPFFSASHVWQGMKGAAGAVAVEPDQRVSLRARRLRRHQGDEHLRRAGRRGAVRRGRRTSSTRRRSNRLVDQLFNAPLGSQQQISQTLYGKFAKANQIEMPMWTGNQWMMLDCSKPIKPVVNQTRRPLQLTPMVKLDDPNVFYQKRFDFGMDYRGAVKAIAWWLAYGCQGSSGAPTTGA